MSTEPEPAQRTVQILFCLILLVISVQSGFPCTFGIWPVTAEAAYARVVDSLDHPAAGALVQIYRHKEDGIEVIAETKADEEGRFESRDYPPGRYMMRAGADGFAYSYASAKLGNSWRRIKKREIVFKLVPWGEWSGTVKTQKISNRK